MKSGYVTVPGGGFLHRRVYERAHGRIPSGYEVHHIDGRKDNNYIENLIAIPKAVHKRIHANFNLHELPNRERIEERLAHYLAQNVDLKKALVEYERELLILQTKIGDIKKRLGISLTQPDPKKAKQKSAGLNWKRKTPKIIHQWSSWKK